MLKSIIFILKSGNSYCMWYLIYNIFLKYNPESDFFRSRISIRCIPIQYFICMPFTYSYVYVCGCMLYCTVQCTHVFCTVLYTCVHMCKVKLLVIMGETFLYCTQYVSSAVYTITYTCGEMGDNPRRWHPWSVKNSRFCQNPIAVQPEDLAVKPGKVKRLNFG